ncbi:DUF5690 family protein [Stenotrophomonas rhizophila]|uniref:DUF5690 family protein n=1 Tax=Stenotrophomonas rhizophila TaxID=216778 RepID=UPI001E562652|nr:DUF5690 family protein [Stenotrophomonas rhizophila]MCC7633540.1 hypothetical protein [Stenotrophomonas rhizophila]MCC7662975.1 hypothetical protein [Stenotrophomonas rhizophila]
MTAAATLARLRQHPAWISVFAGAVALSTYSCMYAFRKPFAAATFDGGDSLFGLDYKVWLVIAQVLGYMCSKFVGIGVIGGLRREHRQALLLGLMACAWLALLGFATVPAPWNIPFLFLNGLPLGMVWGLVFSYLEGRRSTEVMAAILASSFIMASGIVKSVGKWLLLQGVSEYWMPFLTGLLFLPLLLLSIRMLERIPDPDAADRRERSVRRPMDRAERRAFVRRFLPGLVLVVLCYLCLTVVRDFRDSFEAELLTDLGYGHSAGVFVLIETPIAVAVLALTAGLSWFRDHLRGLMVLHGMMLSGLLIAGLSTLAFQAHWLPPLTWLGLTGFGLYLAYVPFNCVFYERLISTFRIAGNVGFLMYLSDAFGYLGSVLVLLARELARVQLSWVEFFGQAVLHLALLGSLCLIGSAAYFHGRARRERHATAAPAV